MLWKPLLFAASAAAVALAAGTSSAQEVRAAQPGALEEIVVTARKVEENLMEVPVAISAVGAAQLQAAGIKDLATLAMYTPGLMVDKGTGALSRQLTFRGLSVASGQIFIDGAPYTGPSNLYLGNLERVEVLVGPQSAYFGRATFTGALNYVTKAPSAEFGVDLNAEYATRNYHDISASIEGPIAGERLTARLSAQHSFRGGHWESATDRNYEMGAIKQSSASLTLDFQPTENISIRVNGIYNLEESSARATINLVGANPNPNVIQTLRCDLGGRFGNVPAQYACGALPTAGEVDPRIISTNSGLNAFQQFVFFESFPNNPLTITHFDRKFKETPGEKRELFGGTARIDVDLLDGWTATYAGAYFYTKGQTINWANQRDDRGLVPSPLYSPTNFPPNCTLGVGTCGVNQWVSIGPLLGQTVNQDYSHELRVTTPPERSLRGTAGASWLLSKNPGGTNTGFVPTTVGVITCCPTASRDSTPAFFGGLYYDITDRLTIGGEARYQWDILSREPQLSRPAGGPLVAVPAPRFGETFTSFSPRVTIDYTLDDHLLFALWSRGYRPGGFNNALVNSPPATIAQLQALFNAGIAFEQEKLDNYEVGLKSTWLNGRLQTILGAYYQQWRNGQISNSVVLVGTGGSIDNFSLILNVGAVDLYGFEGSAAWAVTDNLVVNATLNYQTSDIKEYVYTPHGLRIRNSTNVTGNKFQGARDWSWTLSPQYTNRLSGDWEWFARVDWKHKGKYYVDPTNVAWIDPHDIVDASIGITTGTLRLTLYGKNLTDDDHFLAAVKQFDDQLCCVTGNTVGTSTVNAIQVALPERRQFGIRAAYEF